MEGAADDNDKAYLLAQDPRNPEPAFVLSSPFWPVGLRLKDDSLGINCCQTMPGLPIVYLAPINANIVERRWVLWEDVWASL